MAHDRGTSFALCLSVIAAVSLALGACSGSGREAGLGDAGEDRASGTVVDSSAGGDSTGSNDTAVEDSVSSGDRDSRTDSGGDATTSGIEAGDGSMMFPDASCSPLQTVDETNLQQCTSCSTITACTSTEPLNACCTWVAAPKDALADGIGLHRYSTNVPTAVPDLSCLSKPTTLGTPQTVTLTGYVLLFSSGQDSADVQVDIYTENHPQTPDGSISATSLGTYTTSTSDALDPTDTTWDTKCPNGCSYRQYTIKNVPTETPLVIRTSDAGSSVWATRYEYNVYFSNSVVQSGQVIYDATAIAGPDVSTVAGTIGLTMESGMGLIMGEVHDCTDIRLVGATVETNQSHQGPLFYFTDNESFPLPSLQAPDTGHLGLFGALNMQPNTPTRLTAVGQCPPNAAASAPPICNKGDYVMLGTYVGTPCTDPVLDGPRGVTQARGRGRSVSA
jgi:hypothetical protein